MARIVHEPDQHELTQRIRAAQAAKEAVPMDPWQLQRLVHGYFEFRKIEEHLRVVFPRGSVTLMVARLAGVAHTVSSMAHAGLVPVSLYKHIAEELTAYQEWAHENSNHAASSDADLRRSLEEDVVASDEWSNWARRLLDPEYAKQAPERPEMMRAIQALVDERNVLLESLRMDAAFGAKDDGWSQWAQQALGLSDAYVEEQKLGVDDLRRMIRERL